MTVEELMKGGGGERKGGTIYKAFNAVYYFGAGRNYRNFTFSALKKFI